MPIMSRTSPMSQTLPKISVDRLMRPHRFNVGENVVIPYGSAHYEAKVMDFEFVKSSVWYYVHYTGYNKRHDAWFEEKVPLKFTEKNRKLISYANLLRRPRYAVPPVVLHEPDEFVATDASPTDGVESPTDGVEPPPDGVMPPPDEVMQPPDGVEPQTDGVVAPADALVPLTDGVEPTTDGAVPTFDTELQSDDGIKSLATGVPPSGVLTSPHHGSSQLPFAEIGQPHGVIPLPDERVSPPIRILLLGSPPNGMAMSPEAEVMLLDCGEPPINSSAPQLNDWVPLPDAELPLADTEVALSEGLVPSTGGVVQPATDVLSPPASVTPDQQPEWIDPLDVVVMQPYLVVPPKQTYARNRGKRVVKPPTPCRIYGMIDSSSDSDSEPPPPKKYQRFDEA